MRQHIHLTADSFIDRSGDRIEPKRAVIVATPGNNTIVAAVSGKRIRVLSAIAYASADSVVRFESAAGGTALTGQMNLFADATTVGIAGTTGMLLLPYQKIGHFETEENQVLNLELSGGNLNGVLSYIEV